MGPGLDLTSNKEHDDSVFHIFTYVCGKGWESSAKKMKGRCVLGACSNTTTFYGEMIILNRRSILAAGHLSEFGGLF